MRQLRNVIEKMVVLATGEKLTADDVPMEIRSPVQPEPASAAPAIADDGSLADAERAKILSVLDSCKGNKSKAAELLGISRRTLHRKLNAWKIN